MTDAALGFWSFPLSPNQEVKCASSTREQHSLLTLTVAIHMKKENNSVWWKEYIPTYSKSWCFAEGPAALVFNLKLSSSDQLLHIEQHVNKVQQALINEKKKEKSLGRKRNQHFHNITVPQCHGCFSSLSEAAWREAQLELHLTSTHASPSPSALHPLEETWQRSERSGNAELETLQWALNLMCGSVSVLPAPWGERGKRRLTDKNNNNWFIPTPGLFFRANCYCKVLAFTSIIVKVSWKNSAMDVLLRYN